MSPNLNARRRELLLIMRHPRGARQCLLESRELQRTQFVAACALDRIARPGRLNARILFAHVPFACDDSSRLLKQRFQCQRR